MTPESQSFPAPPGPAERRTVRVPPELSGLRLDRVLTTLIPGVSRMHVKELIQDGRVTVDGLASNKPGVEVLGGQELGFEVAPRRKLRFEPGDPRSLHVLHEDEALIVVDKAPGVLSHPSDTVSGSSVSELAVLRFGPLPSLQGKDRPGIVHRLDAGTSGAMVLARTEPAFLDLMRQFRSRQVVKTYLALVYGEPRFDTGWIEGALERSPEDSSRMQVAAAGSATARPAQTYYEVRERFRGLTLVAALPKTGRTHQIRVHLASAGMPLVGDKLYRRKGGPSIRLPGEAPIPPRQCLHASELRFHHPLTGEPVHFEAPLPEDFARMLAWTRANLGG
jgi:23S rRNA pseudouridine1911/1915/1917 synthase